MRSAIQAKIQKAVVWRTERWVSLALAGGAPTGSKCVRILI
jgi:hypothetical protein